MQLILYTVRTRRTAVRIDAASAGAQGWRCMTPDPTLGHPEPLTANAVDLTAKHAVRIRVTTVRARTAAEAIGAMGSAALSEVVVDRAEQTPEGM